MAGRSDEVKACMNAEVDSVGSAWLLFLQHVGLMLIIQKFNDRHPRVAVVDVVTEARSVNDGQADYRCIALVLAFQLSKADEDHTLEEFLF